MTDGIISMPYNPALSGLARLVPDVVFSEKHHLKLTLITPWNEDGKYPLIVFIQGSAWQFPDINYEIPQLSKFAQAGYVVATVTHRNCMDGHPFPAFLQDVKTAIRFLRANAAQYHIDPARVCAFGTSSGGNTALLLGLTGDDARYKTEEYKDESDAVRLVVECFGPTDMLKMGGGEPPKEGEGNDLVTALVGGKVLEHLDVLTAMSPALICKKGAQYPPMLIIHGDADDVVPYAQGVEMYEKLKALGQDARMVRIVGAPHEHSFWSAALHAHILDYINEKL